MGLTARATSIALEVNKTASFSIKEGKSTSVVLDFEVQSGTLSLEAGTKLSLQLDKNLAATWSSIAVSEGETNWAVVAGSKTDTTMTLTNANAVSASFSIVLEMTITLGDTLQKGEVSISNAQSTYLDFDIPAIDNLKTIPLEICIVKPSATGDFSSSICIANGISRMLWTPLLGEGNTPTNTMSLVLAWDNTKVSQEQIQLYLDFPINKGKTSKPLVDKDHADLKVVWNQGKTATFGAYSIGQQSPYTDANGNDYFRYPITIPALGDRKNLDSIIIQITNLVCPAQGYSSATEKSAQLFLSWPAPSKSIEDEDAMISHSFPFFKLAAPTIETLTVKNSPAYTQEVDNYQQLANPTPDNVVLNWKLNGDASATGFKEYCSQFKYKIILPIENNDFPATDLTSDNWNTLGNTLSLSKIISGNLTNLLPIDYDGQITLNETITLEIYPRSADYKYSTIVAQKDLAVQYYYPTIFVDKQATGANNGTNWTDAFTTIDAAIDFYRQHKECSTIKIAPGNYTIKNQENLAIDFTNDIEIIKKENTSTSTTMISLADGITVADYTCWEFHKKVSFKNIQFSDVLFQFSGSAALEIDNCSFQTTDKLKCEGAIIKLNNTDGSNILNTSTFGWKDRSGILVSSGINAKFTQCNFIQKNAEAKYAINAIAAAVTIDKCIFKTRSDSKSSSIFLNDDDSRSSNYNIKHSVFILYSTEADTNAIKISQGFSTIENCIFRFMNNSTTRALYNDAGLSYIQKCRFIGNNFEGSSATDPIIYSGENAAIGELSQCRFYHLGERELIRVNSYRMGTSDCCSYNLFSGNGNIDSQTQLINANTSLIACVFDRKSDLIIRRLDGGSKQNGLYYHLFQQDIDIHDCGPFDESDNKVLAYNSGQRVYMDDDTLQVNTSIINQMDSPPRFFINGDPLLPKWRDYEGGDISDDMLPWIKIFLQVNNASTMSIQSGKKITFTLDVEVKRGIVYLENDPVILQLTGNSAASWSNIAVSEEESNWSVYNQTDKNTVTLTNANPVSGSFSIGLEMTIALSDTQQTEGTHFNNLQSAYLDFQIPTIDDPEKRGINLAISKPDSEE